MRSERHWTDEEAVRLTKIVGWYDRGRIPWLQVANKMNRTIDSCKNKWDRMEGCRRFEPVRASKAERIDNTRPPRETLIDRDRRYNLAPRDLTASMMGDPLPGFSALERGPVK